MAGSIIISPGVAIAFNSFGFQVVTEQTRKELSGALVEEIYAPMDDGGMPFISLKATGTDVLRAFFEATQIALRKWAAQNPAPFPEWQELIEKLQADPRLSDSA